MGFQAFAVGSHHFVGALDFQPRLAGKSSHRCRSPNKVAWPRVRSAKCGAPGEPSGPGGSRRNRARSLVAEPIAAVRQRWADRRIGRPRHQHEDDARDLVGEHPAVSLNLYLTVLRSSTPLANRHMASLWPLRWRSVAQAPTARSLRRWRSPILVMRPSRFLPPVELWHGVRPRKAANSRPTRGARARPLRAARAAAGRPSIRRL